MRYAESETFRAALHAFVQGATPEDWVLMLDVVDSRLIDMGDGAPDDEEIMITLRLTPEWRMQL